MKTKFDQSRYLGGSFRNKMAEKRPFLPFSAIFLSKRTSQISTLVKFGFHIRNPHKNLILKRWGLKRFAKKKHFWTPPILGFSSGKKTGVLGGGAPWRESHVRGSRDIATKMKEEDCRYPTMIKRATGDQYLLRKIELKLNMHKKDSQY